VCEKRRNTKSLIESLEIGNHQHKNETTILDHDWTFVNNQKKGNVMVVGTYQYPFEFILPGNLAESVEANSCGYLSYKLKAVVERPAFLSNFVERLPLKIVREYTPTYQLINNTPMRIANEWTGKIDYAITVPKKTFQRGEHINIDFSIVPKTHARLHVRYLSCFLKEYVTFAISGTSQTRTESRIIRFFRDEHFPSSGLHWHKVENMPIPHSVDSILCDTHNDYLRIEHKLKFTMSFINPQGDLSELRSSMPVTIISQLEEETDNELPSYENAWRSQVYSPPLTFLDSAPNSPMDDSYPITPPPHESSGDYFGYRPNSCGELPSYQSVFHDYMLPSYE
jgi:hypothetical protein